RALHIVSFDFITYAFLANALLTPNVLFLILMPNQSSSFFIKSKQEGVARSATGRTTLLLNESMADWVLQLLLFLSLSDTSGLFNIFQKEKEKEGVVVIRYIAQH
ncbi:hypothetical protein ACJX0J_020451, partial [Zea mays]